MTIEKIIIGKNDHIDDETKEQLEKYVTEYNKCAYKMDIIENWLKSANEKRGKEGKRMFSYYFEPLRSQK